MTALAVRPDEVERIVREFEAGVSKCEPNAARDCAMFIVGIAKAQVASHYDGLPMYPDSMRLLAEYVAAHDALVARAAVTP